MWLPLYNLYLLLVHGVYNIMSLLPIYMNGIPWNVPLSVREWLSDAFTRLRASDDYGLDSDTLTVSLVYADGVLCFCLLDYMDSPVYVLDDPSLASVPMELDSFFGPDDELSVSVYGL